MTAVTGDGEAGVTFAAFALQIGKSRPYVSKLKAEGKLTARCFTPEGKIIPSLALADIAANTQRGAAPEPEAERDTYASQRARKTAADAELAELTLRERRGELIERRLVAETLGPWIRELRDDLVAAPRDTVLDPASAAACESAIAERLETFAGRLAGFSETPNDGGARAAG